MGKTTRILLLAVLIGFLDLNPQNIGGITVSGIPWIPENSRLVNTLSDREEFDRIDRFVESFLRKWEIHGASLAIAHEGRVVFAKGYGYPDDMKMFKVEPFNRFRIASVSKLITATAIMKLHEEGLVNMDDKVFGPDGILNSDYFANPKDPRVYDITVAHLLSHKGGWTTRWGDQMFMPYVVASSLDIETPVTTENIVRFALNKRLHFTPGKGRSYSNLGYAVLGLVIEKIAGQPYEDFCRENLFEPLGLFDFQLARNLYEQRRSLEVKYYEPANSIPLKSIYNEKDIVPASYGGNDIEALGGAGAWVATAPDLLRFMMAIDGFDDPKDILSPESIDYMTKQYYGVAPVGWKGTTLNGYWWRTGSFAGTSAMMKRQPDGTEWVILLNTNTWKQSMFPTDINRMMTNALAGIRTWPDVDLSLYSLPVSLEEINPIYP